MSCFFDLPIPSLAVKGSCDRYPVRRIWCVGQNYLDHAREMGATGREDPFFFAKPPDAVVPEGGPVPVPPRTANFHHEIELVVAIGTHGTSISVERALDHVFGFAVGLDLTRRDLQAELKAKGRPWEMSKAFDHSAPIGALHRIAETGPMASGSIWLRVNDAERQRSDLSRMIWSVPEILAQLSSYVVLAPGDLIFTGTPEGVGRLQRGDTLLGGVEGLGELAVTIV